jgi:hypothetical protein
VFEHIDMLSMLEQVYTCEGGSPGAAGSGGRGHEVLATAEHFTLGEIVKVDGYICQEEAQYELVNAQA